MTRDTNILEQIMDRKREEVSKARVHMPESRLLLQLQHRKTEEQEQGPRAGFAASLMAKVKQSEGGVLAQPAIIAEIKRASPSKGEIIPEGTDFIPERIARAYSKQGATCLSCLTDRDFFKGDDGFLATIKADFNDCPPLLRKDFLYDPYQVLQSRLLGADAILLIMAVLQRNQASELEAAAREIGLDVLVEIHDDRELEAAHDLKTPLLGINNRNLKTFKTDLNTSIRLAAQVEVGRLVIAESGIHRAEDILLLQKHGIHAFLIGEAFMRAADPGVALGELLNGCQEERAIAEAKDG